MDILIKVSALDLKELTHGAEQTAWKANIMNFDVLIVLKNGEYWDKNFGSAKYWMDGIWYNCESDNNSRAKISHINVLAF